ncbi:MAG TPA: erythromycin esterase family protein [Kofleriaceae bacterium]|nr:erythromycin esterase family protein [Kofleriaceae bacterium]
MTPRTKLLLACGLVAACQRAGTGPPSTGSHGSLEGIVSLPDGEAGPVLIGITDAVTGASSGVVQSDAEGRFDARLAAGDYALTVTSARGFAFIEHARSPATGLSIALSSDCAAVEGTVRAAPEAGTVAELSRRSKFVGDLFIAPVAANGRFRACLPEGDYQANAGGPLLSKSVRVRVPSASAVEIPAYPRRQIESPPPRASIARFALADLGAALRRGPRVLGFGEANHGTGDFYTQRGALALELARTGGLRYVMLEADAVELLRIDDYVHGAAVDVSAVLVAMGFWITDIEEFTAFLDQVRAYNAGVPAARTVHVLGFDAQMTEPAARLLVAGREELGLSPPEVQLLNRVAPDGGKSFLELDAAEKAALQQLLRRLGDVPSINPRGSTGRAAIAARSLQHQLGYLAESNWVAQGQLRDAAMADLAAFVVERGEPGRACLWAHAAHIAREPYGGVESMGRYLTQRFGADYYPIGFFSYSGTARAWDPGGQIGVIPHELARTPPYYIESAIMEATSYPDIAWVAIAAMPPALRQWLELPRFSREFGSSYSGAEDARTLRAVPTAFDALVVLKRARASTPTPTGERRVAH